MPIGRPSGRFLGTFVGFLMVGGILALLLSSYLLFTLPDIPQKEREIGLLLILLLGSFGFGTMFMVFGWVFLNQNNRIKVMRSMTKKNYGYVHIVTRGNVIMTKIKDFNRALLWMDDGVWEMNPNKIFKELGVSENLGDQAGMPIKAEHIHTISGIPSIFISIDSMKPLSFHMEKGDANPIDLAATLNGYIMNQAAKNMFFKKTMSIMLIIVCILIGANIFLTWQIYTLSEDIKPLLPRLVGIADSWDAIMAAAQTPTVVGG
jgi:hypothetical protein